MKQSCFRMEDLGEIAGLEPGDPRLEHLKECAHCRALLAACCEFNEPSKLPEGLDIEDAEKRLAAVFEQAIHGEPIRRETAATERGAPSPERPPDNLGSRLLRALWKPALRPAWGLGAALAVVLLVIRLVDTGDGGTDRIVPRIDEDPARLELILRAPQSLAGGEVRLGWQPVEGADAYRVLLFDASLDELASLDAGAATILTLQPDEIEGLPESGNQVLWQVVALRRGDELTRSRPAGLRLP
jgi:hypothetical protein